jgi:hypothetical protein
VSSQQRIDAVAGDAAQRQRRPHSPLNGSISPQVGRRNR